LKSPFTDREMKKVPTPQCLKSDKYYQCRDTKTLSLCNHITKQELLDSQDVKQGILDRMKA
jgi:hypothetical protein